MRAPTSLQAEAEAALAELLPRPAASATAIPRQAQGDTPAAARLAEHRAGRDAAHRAMLRFLPDPPPLASGPRGTPLWPAGLVGSIAHVADIAIAAVAPASQLSAIGIDVEHLAGLSADIAPIVLSARERRVPSGVDPRHWLAAHFSAKESVYKCISSEVDRVIDFTEVGLCFDWPHRQFTAHPLAEMLAETRLGRVTGSVAIVAGHVFSAAWIAPCTPTGDAQGAPRGAGLR